MKNTICENCKSYEPHDELVGWCERLQMHVGGADGCGNYSEKDES